MIGNVGLVIFAGLGFYLPAQNVFRRYQPRVEILPAPPEEEPLVELLPPPARKLDDSSAETLEPILGTPLTEIESDFADDNITFPEIPYVDLSLRDVTSVNLPLSLSAIVPSRVQAGTGALFQLKITNTSERSMDYTDIACHFSGSLAFPGSSIHHVKRPLSCLKPNDSREVMLTLVGTEPGWGLCRFILTAQGIEPIEQQYQIQVIPRVWDLSLIGPETRAAGQRSEFMLRLSNRTTEDLCGLQIGMTAASLLKPTALSGGLQHDGTGHIWKPSDLAPGQSLLLPFEFMCAEASEQACVSVWVNGESIPEDKIDACLTITPPHDQLGIEFADVKDPVRRGDDIVYEGRIENRSLQSMHDVRIVLKSTSEVALIAVDAAWEPAYLMLPKLDWVIEQQRLQCNNIGEFPTNARLKLSVTARGVELGDARLRLDVTMKENSTPLSITEFTSVAAPFP
ncbi:MAG: hypothetical protein O3A29_00855 [Planctomycetota bacterium]|nr:hypothetical protein [Planctomycetota bacterium]